MPEPLWKIRERKGMSVNQLAAKSGVPAISIQEYESGRAIRSADLPKLAKVLYVEEWDIEIEGAPRPKRAKPDRRRPAKPQRPAEEVQQPKKPRRAAPPARSSQIEHLLTLTTHNFDQDRAALEKEIGKPLEQMTKREASDLLSRYQRLLVESRADETSGGPKAKRKRAYLPEGVDEFELKYLTTQQEAGALLHFTLFDGTERSGRIVGFSPYSITIQDEETGDEVTIQKLAVVYYRVADEDAAEGGTS